jgi:hypothetical protein
MLKTWKWDEREAKQIKVQLDLGNQPSPFTMIIWQSDNWHILSGGMIEPCEKDSYLTGMRAKGAWGGHREIVVSSSCQCTTYQPECNLNPLFKLWFQHSTISVGVMAPVCAGACKSVLRCLCSSLQSGGSHGGRGTAGSLFY